MTYIVGGTPRAGKSTLRKYFLEKHRISGFCTDYLRDAIDHNVPVIGIKKGMSDAEKSEILWPYFQRILAQRSKYYRDDLLIEGTNFLPKYLSIFQGDPNIRIVFLGYSRITPEKKVMNIKKFTASDDDWTRDFNDTELRTLANELIEISRYFESECNKYGIKYFDTSEGINSVIKEAANYLLES
ncbi:hypothetical protein HZB69_04080 [Candidatus Amesbacteria bacterium]|nr:hypothetical protein [Candidatus Amesbacteria bacterium]